MNDRKYGKSISGLWQCVAVAIKGGTSMYATQNGNVVIMNEQEYKRLKKLGQGKKQEGKNEGKIVS